MRRPAGNGRRKGLGFRIPRLPLGTRRVVPRRPAAEGSEWEVCHESPGRIRFQNERLHRRKEVCQAIERELMSILGIDNYKTSDLTGSVLILYDARQLNKAQLVEILDSAIAQAEVPEGKDKADLHLPLCTASLPLAAAAQFLAPPLLPVAAALFLYTSIPTFRNAREVLFVERRLGVDVLDAIVVVGCLGTMQIFPGTVLCWCLGFGRVLVKKTQDDSKRLLLNAFGKQPRYVWLYKDGVEVQVSMDRLQAGDVIVVNTGEVVPVDGFIKEGMAMIDQHALTGESTPAEKGIGDRVFASTVMVAGKVYVEVEKAGNETASAKISQILNDTAGYKLTSQHKGERLADKAVIPTLALASVGMATLGPAGAVAILNSDFGTGIRMAAPLAMLSSLALCAHKGILVKDGRALELMNEVDTVLFDKTGTLTRERPEVGRVIACNGHDPEAILRYAAAAEAKFAHPIAKAILHAFEATGQPLPPIDDSRYHVGYGITVHIEGHAIRVGSARFMDLENIAIPPEVHAALDAAHREGNTLVMVAVDDALGGAIELQAVVRPEVRSIIEGLRKRGIKHIAIISGDHDAPTRKLAESLGMDRYFAQVLPADKADYVEKLQKEGRKVCFVGDGINDSIALKKANVSISLRGATSIATDTAHIVFMEEGLSKLCDLRDIARDLDQQRQAELAVDPGAQRPVHRRRVHDGLRRDDVGADQQRRGPGGAGQRHAPAAADRPGPGREPARAGPAGGAGPGRPGRARDRSWRSTRPRPTSRSRSRPPRHRVDATAEEVVIEVPAPASRCPGRRGHDRPRRAVLRPPGRVPLRAPAEEDAGRRAEAGDPGGGGPAERPAPVPGGIRVARGRPGAEVQVEHAAHVCGVRAGADRRLRETLAGHADARHRVQSAAGDPVHRGDRR